MENRQHQKSAFATITAFFFMWGFLTCLNDISGAASQTGLRSELYQGDADSVHFLCGVLYHVDPRGEADRARGLSARHRRRAGNRGGGALLFYPAAGQLSYPLFLTALFVLATGITVLQVAANPYAAILGKPETASSRLNLAQAVNSLGHTTAPLIGGLLILGTTLSAEQLAQLPAAEQTAANLAKAASVQGPYLDWRRRCFALAIVMALIKLPVIAAVEDSHSKTARLRDALKHRHLRLAAIGIFLYVGAEVSIGSFLVNFFGQKEIAGLAEASAAGFVSYYWGSAMIGRFIGSALLQRLKPRLVLSVAASAAALLVLITLGISGTVAMWTILAVGFFNSVMFPIIFTLGIEDLGR